MNDPRNRQYTNGEITVFWIPSKCIHATTCFRELIEVFNPGRRPWVNMNGAPTRRIIEVVNKCPTQALVWKYNRDLSETEKMAGKQLAREEVNPETLAGNRKDEERQEGQPVREPKAKPASVRIMKDGPIVVEGKFRIIGPEEEELEPAIMTSFCRCGNSGNMPYCDGTHRRIGFTDESI